MKDLNTEENFLKTKNNNSNNSENYDNLNSFMINS